LLADIIVKSAKPKDKFCKLFDATSKRNSQVADGVEKSTLAKLTNQISFNENKHSRQVERS
jgi:hypothetical protein